MYCAKCGKEIYRVERFCQYCGAALQDNVKKSERGYKPSMPVYRIATTRPPCSRPQGYLSWPIIPKTYLWQSIALLLCGSPFALVALPFAIGARNKLSEGDLEMAWRKGEKARRWCVAGVMAPVMTVVAFFCIAVISY